MAKAKTEDWKILSDSELVQRARRLTIVGLVIAIVIVAALGYVMGSSPVQETAGPARAVRLPVVPEKPADTTAANVPTAPPAADAQLPPNPWLRKKPGPPASQQPPRPPGSDGKVYDL